MGHICCWIINSTINYGNLITNFVLAVYVKWYVFTSCLEKQGMLPKHTKFVSELSNFLKPHEHLREMYETKPKEAKKNLDKLIRDSENKKQDTTELRKTLSEWNAEVSNSP